MPRRPLLILALVLSAVLGIAAGVLLVQPGDPTAAWCQQTISRRAPGTTPWGRAESRRAGLGITHIFIRMQTDSSGTWLTGSATCRVGVPFQLEITTYDLPAPPD